MVLTTVKALDWFAPSIQKWPGDIPLLYARYSVLTLDRHRVLPPFFTVLVAHLRSMLDSLGSCIRTVHNPAIVDFLFQFQIKNVVEALEMKGCQVALLSNLDVAFSSRNIICVVTPR